MEKGRDENGSNVAMSEKRDGGCCWKVRPASSNHSIKSTSSSRSESVGILKIFSDLSCCSTHISAALHVAASRWVAVTAVVRRVAILKFVLYFLVKFFIFSTLQFFRIWLFDSSHLSKFNHFDSTLFLLIFFLKKT